MLKITGPVEGKKGFFHAQGKSATGGAVSVVVWEKPNEQFQIIALKDHPSFIDNKRVISYAGGILAKGESNESGTSLTFEKLSPLLRRDKKREQEESKEQLAQYQAQVQDLMNLAKEQSATIQQLTTSQGDGKDTGSELAEMRKQLAAQQKELDALKAKKPAPKAKAKPAEEKAE